MNGSIFNALRSFAAGKDSGRPALECVHFTPEYAEASNGFMLGQYYYSGDAPDVPFLVNLAAVKAAAKDHVEIIPESDGVRVVAGPATYMVESCSDQYPCTEAVWPKYQPLVRVCLDGRNLAAATFLAASVSGNNALVLDITTPSAPVVWRSVNDKARGIIMPVYMHNGFEQFGPVGTSEVDALLNEARLALRGEGDKDAILKKLEARAK